MTSKIITSCIHRAIEYAPKHPQYSHYLHYSFIIQDNKIIEWGTNQEGVPPRHFGYHSRVTVPKLHSELVAYRKGRGLLKKGKPFEMLNIRVNRHNELKIAAPCVVCQEWLASVGCTLVWFTTEGKIGKLYL